MFFENASPHGLPCSERVMLINLNTFMSGRIIDLPRDRHCIPQDEVELLAPDHSMLLLPDGALGEHPGHVEHAWAWKLLEQLSRDGISTWTSLSWWLAREIGARDARVGLVLPQTVSAFDVASWIQLLSPFAASALLPIPPRLLEQRGEETLLASDLAALPGLGVHPVCAGWTGRALVGLSLPELRDELETCHAFMTRTTGAPAMILAPNHNDFGVAVDGLVLEEARRVGFQRVITEPLQPLRGENTVWWSAPRLELGDRPEEVVERWRARGTRRGDTIQAARVVARRGQKIGASVLSRLRRGGDGDGK